MGVTRARRGRRRTRFFPGGAESRLNLNSVSAGLSSVSFLSLPDAPALPSLLLSLVAGESERERKSRGGHDPIRVTDPSNWIARALARKPLGLLPSRSAAELLGSSRKQQGGAKGESSGRRAVGPRANPLPLVAVGHRRKNSVPRAAEGFPGWKKQRRPAALALWQQTRSPRLAPRAGPVRRQGQVAALGV